MKAPTMDDSIRMTIDGKPAAGATELDAAVTAATAAFPGWRDTPWAGRAALVVRIGETVSVWINEALAVSPFAAFGGRKQSGIGAENGLEGLLAYTEPKTISVMRKTP